MKTIDKIVPIKCNKCGKEIGNAHAQFANHDGDLPVIKSIRAPEYGVFLEMLCNECTEAIGDQI